MAMIKCPECGKEISDKASACVNCGCPIERTTTICKECGKEISNKATVCMYCGCPVEVEAQVYAEKQVYSEPDIPSVGLNILSFFLPIIGLILYIVYNDKAPKKAKAIGKWAIIGFAVDLVCSAAIYGMSLSLLLW